MSVLVRYRTVILYFCLNYKLFFIWIKDYEISLLGRNIHVVKRLLIIWIISINIVYIHPVWCIIVSWSVFKNRITAKTLCMYNSVGERRWLWIICTVPTNPTLLIYDMTLCCNMWNNFWLILCLKSFSWNTSCLNYAKHGQEITHHQEGEIIKSSK